jgi:hypothetical protein
MKRIYMKPSDPELRYYDSFVTSFNKNMFLESLSKGWTLIKTDKHKYYLSPPITHKSSMWAANFYEIDYYGNIISVPHYIEELYHKDEL